MMLVFNSFLEHNLQALAAFPNMSHPARRGEMEKVHDEKGDCSGMFVMVMEQ